MVEYKVKYKISSIVVIVLIVLIVVGVLFVNFSYLKAKKYKLTQIAELKVTEQEVAALEQVKAWTVDNSDYNTLQPITSADAVKAEPSTKANPFTNKEQKE